jgi:DNA repair photolyase
MGIEQPTLFPEPDGWGDGRSLHDVEYIHTRAKRIVNHVPEASRMPFRYTINAYRGCAHACTYCFARPTHEFLGMNAAEEFERRIVVKVNAVEKLRRELRDPRWGGDHIAMGTNTDPYQPAEGRYKLTRGIIEVLGEARNEFSILTKSPMIVRDLDVLVGRPGARTCAATSRSARSTTTSGGRASRARRRRGSGSTRSAA